MCCRTCDRGSAPSMLPLSTHKPFRIGHGFGAQCLFPVPAMHHAYNAMHFLLSLCLHFTLLAVSWNFNMANAGFNLSTISYDYSNSAESSKGLPLSSHYHLIRHITMLYLIVWLLDQPHQLFFLWRQRGWNLLP